MNGAVALINVRGPEQLASVVGVRMLMQATISLMVSCLEMVRVIGRTVYSYSRGPCVMVQISVAFSQTQLVTTLVI